MCSQSISYYSVPHTILLYVHVATRLRANLHLVDAIATAKYNIDTLKSNLKFNLQKAMPDTAHHYLPLQHKWTQFTVYIHDNDYFTSQYKTWSSQSIYIRNVFSVKLDVTHSQFDILIYLSSNRTSAFNLVVFVMNLND